MADADAIGDEDRQLAAFYDSGAEITGAVGATAIALLLPAPAGPIVGAAAQTLLTGTLRRGAIEATHRQLSHREQVRVAAVLRFASARIERNLGLGYEPRADGFFRGEPGNRSIAEELAEGVLLTAQREHEERKLPYLGNLLASLAFQEGIDRGMANMLLRRAEGLSYRQISLLALFERKEEFPQLRPATFQGIQPGDLPQVDHLELIGILAEVEELTNLEMVSHEVRIMFGSGEGLNPSTVALWRWGSVLYDFMELREVPAAELQTLADRLR